jgi:hypothetical protein
MLNAYASIIYMNVRGNSAVLLRLAFVVFITVSFASILSSNASAAQITARSLTLQAGVTDGGSKPSGVVQHFFQFTLPAVGNPSVGSIKFQYCTLAIGACTTPAGLSTTSSSYGSETGATGFSLVNTTNGSPYITRSASSIAAGTAVSYQLLGVTNPSGADCFGGTPPPSDNCTFFVRISTYASTDTTGSSIDTGVVAASISQQITLTGQMPESLIFCTGGTVGTNAGIPDCSTATSGSIVFNQLFSPTSTATTSSQMAASTNAGSGYSVTVNGATLTSGSNTITTMGSATTGVHGLSQFGLNLVANTTSTSTPAVGANVAPTPNGTNYRGEAASPYDTADTFKFATGNIVASSTNGGAGGTDAQIFTVSYIVNVPGSQPAGTYTTTLTYVCTATF